MMTATTNNPGRGEGHKVGIVILDLDTVGIEIYRLLNEKAEGFKCRVNSPVEVVGIAMSDKTKSRPNVDEDLPTDDALSLAQRDDTDLVVEAIGSIDYPRRVVLEALHASRPAVTANRVPVAAYSEELSEAADSSGVDLFFEAAVTAAIPVVGPLRRSPAGDTVNTVMDIVNGITNLIPDTINSTSADYDETLAEATRLGYAEVDPAIDVEDRDAASEATILVSLTFHTRIAADDIHCEGITEITADDIVAARNVDCTIKLLATCERVTGENGRESISACVYPVLTPRHHPLATVCESFNAIFIEVGAAGRLMFYSNGAGGNPTASTVLGDLAVATRNTVYDGRASGDSTYANLPILDFGDVRTRYHIDLHVNDRVRVLADVARTFSSHNISLRIIHQEEDANGVRLVVVTHKALEKDLEVTVDKLRVNDAILVVSNTIRIEGMDI